MRVKPNVPEVPQYVLSQLQLYSATWMPPTATRGSAVPLKPSGESRSQVIQLNLSSQNQILAGLKVADKSDRRHILVGLLENLRPRLQLFGGRASEQSGFRTIAVAI